MKRRSDAGPSSSLAPTVVSSLFLRVSSLFLRLTSPTLRTLSVKLAGNASDVIAFIGGSSCSDAMRRKAIHQSRQVTLICQQVEVNSWLLPPVR